jgi:hypothetical protein
MAGSENGTIGVVIERDQVRPPSHEHLVLRIEQDAESRFEGVRPRLWCAERGRGPVEGADERSHVTAAQKPLLARGCVLDQCMPPPNVLNSRSRGGSIHDREGETSKPGHSPKEVRRYRSTLCRLGFRNPFIELWQPIIPGPESSPMPNDWARSRPCRGCQRGPNSDPCHCARADQLTERQPNICAVPVFFMLTLKRTPACISVLHPFKNRSAGSQRHLRATMGYGGNLPDAVTVVFDHVSLQQCRRFEQVITAATGSWQL